MTTIIKTALDALRCSTSVDCDTLDATTAEQYGPFQDCTSNQIIAYNELATGQHEALLERAAELAVEIHHEYSEMRVEVLAGEFATILLSLRMVPYLKGSNHVQVNTHNSESTEKIIVDGKRIRSLAIYTQTQDYDPSRLCIKVPSTWAGLRACRALEEKGIRTLATTLFSYTQGIVAAEAGCKYIAPYIHSLPEVMGIGPPDSEVAVAQIIRKAVECQQYYETNGLRTQVLPAALLNVAECLMLQGVHHITLSPARLQELHALSAVQGEDLAGNLFARPEIATGPQLGLGADSVAAIQSAEQAREPAGRMIEDEQAFYDALVKEADGLAFSPATNMSNAIAIFNDYQTKLEQMMLPYCLKVEGSKGRV